MSIKSVEKLRKYRCFIHIYKLDLTLYIFNVNIRHFYGTHLLGIIKHLALIKQIRSFPYILMCDCSFPYFTFLKVSRVLKAYFFVVRKKLNNGWKNCWLTRDCKTLGTEGQCDRASENKTYPSFLQEFASLMLLREYLPLVWK